MKVTSLQQLSHVLNEPYTTVRNNYARGRQPRDIGALGIADAGPVSFNAHHRFVVADLLAWRIVRDLTGTGLTWETAARIVRSERVADLALRNEIGPDLFFAVWMFRDRTVDPGAWRGAPKEIAEIVAHDIERHGQISSIRMVSLRDAFDTINLTAEVQGYTFEGGEIVLLDRES
jgi:hypothetical protein